MKPRISRAGCIASSGIKLGMLRLCHVEDANKDLKFGSRNSCKKNNRAVVTDCGYRSSEDLMGFNILNRVNMMYALTEIPSAILLVGRCD